jgi:D-glycerate 3-kinase|tara:strand:- start:3644 stop:4567 length:924 start_codon:yes stop_codon:yes gene_type:complete
MSSVNECFDNVKEDCFKFLKKEKIFGKSKAEKIKSLKKIYIPISFWIENKYKKNRKTLFLGLSGGQGSGKTTVSEILKIILKIFFKREVHVSSIDDFYKTLKDRDKMSKTIHPLFKTRGVPGTHEIKLLKKFFIFFKRKRFKKFKLPKFDKSMDDRLKQERWIRVKKKPDIVILEGWCVGAKPQKGFLLKKPINILEKYEDANCAWRKYANEQLKREYKKIFSMIDHYIFMKIPNFNMVFKWRHLQEKKLRKRSRFKNRIMSIVEIKKFIMFYERITLQMLKDLVKSASIVIMLNTKHEIKRLIFKK